MITVPVRLREGFGVLLLCAGVAATAFPSPGESTPPPGPPVNANPPYADELDQRARKLFYSTDMERLDLLKVYLLADLPTLEDTARLRKIELRQVSQEDAEWLCRLAAGDEAAPRARYVEWLLAVVYRTNDAPGIRNTILSEYDRQCGLIVELRGAKSATDWRARESRWSRLTVAIREYGSANMLTPLFWKALEVEGFSDRHVLSMHANPDTLRRLAEYKDTPIWRDPDLRERIEGIERDVRLVMEFPEVRHVHPRYFGDLLSNLAIKTTIMSPERTRAWLQATLNDIRKAMQDEKTSLTTGAAETQPVTTKPTTD